MSSKKLRPKSASSPSTPSSSSASQPTPIEIPETIIAMYKSKVMTGSKIAAVAANHGYDSHVIPLSSIDTSISASGTPGSEGSGALKLSKSTSGGAEKKEGAAKGKEAAAVTDEGEKQAAVAASSSASSNASSSPPSIPNQLVLHPLRYKWVWWHDCASKSKSAAWGENLKQLMSLQTVEHFWSLFNNIAPPSQLQVGSDYSLFKENIEPQWEDPANAKGGRWQLTVPKARKDRLDRLWVALLLGVIGDTIRSSENVTGCAVSIRQQKFRLAIWVGNGRNAESCKEIGKSMREILHAPNSEQISFDLHDTVSKSKNSRPAPLYRA